MTTQRKETAGRGQSQLGVTEPGPALLARRFPLGTKRPRVLTMHLRIGVITPCGRRQMVSATSWTTKDWREVTCKACLRAMKSHGWIAKLPYPPTDKSAPQWVLPEGGEMVLSLNQRDVPPVTRGDL